MTVKQNWLWERLLVPAGILPPALTYSDLHYNESLRENIGNVGFEYFYILDQDASRINSSAIGGKIFAIHAPWPEFDHHSISNPLIHKMANYFLFGGKKTNADFEDMASRTFNFAKVVGAKVATFHIEFLDHKRLAENLAHLDKLEREAGITCAIEYDGAYIPELVARGREYLKIDDSYDWMTNPVKMMHELDRIYPAKKFGICLDTSSLIGCELPVVETTKKVIDRIVHVHLSGSVPGKDLATEIDSPEIVEVVEILYENKYEGYITAEINATLGDNEQRLALIHGGLSILGIGLLKGTMAKNAQGHIRRSCEYLLKHLSSQGLD